MTTSSLDFALRTNQYPMEPMECLMKESSLNASSKKAPPHSSVVIIGSGFSGLGMAINLKRQGFEDFVVLERASDVGGVWRDNLYPGCACDVESYLYSFSFAPNPHWTRTFSPQNEIWDYLRDCAKRFDVLKNIRFQEELVKASWDEQAQHWAVETSKGLLTTNILISGTGAFSEPLIPSFPGFKNFKGASFHSSSWNHDFDLTGKKVAVIGTGASAIQFIPKIQPQVSQLTVYQRTPPWIMPKADRPIKAEEKARFERMPILQKAARLLIYGWRETYGTTFRHPKLMGFGKDMALHHMHKRIKDPALIEKLTPTYQIGCKRILLSNDYYPALAKPNVDVITDSIEDITATGIVTKDGKHQEFDAIIWGTGFKVTDFAIAHRIHGRDGQSLSAQWKGSASAFLGTSIPGFPNFFTLLGPNTGLGHSSVILMIEAQIELVMESIAYIRKNKFAAIEPKPERELAFIKELDRRSAGTVWVLGGCQSWYLDSKGRNSTLWPGSIGAFKRRILPFKKNEYNIKKA